VSANRNAEASLSATGTPPRADAMPPLSRSPLPLAAYGLATGIAATSAGLWASSGLSGAAQLTVWAGVSAALALGAVWLAEPVVSLLTRQRRGRHPRTLR
jgi:hypothetical protein